MHGRSIIDFFPRWLPSEERLRYGMGISIVCPTHGEPCRLEFWFLHPSDGCGPEQGKPLWHSEGGPLDKITIYPPESFEDITVLAEPVRTGRPLRVPRHWVGWIVSGEVLTASVDDEAETEPDVLVTEDV